MNRSGKLAIGVLGAWFAFALTASALHMFTNASNRVGAAVAIAAAAPLMAFALWFMSSREFRTFVLSLDPRVLTAVQTWRLLGFVFVLLESRNLLPRVFALPAGYGDMFIGATASLVGFNLAKRKYRNSFIFWQLIGIADLVTAVSLGVTAPIHSPAGPSMLPMTILPLSLVPTFLVPLFLMLHVITIAQARSWKWEADHSRLDLATTRAA